MLAQIGFIQVTLIMRPGKIVLIRRLVRVGVRWAHGLIGIALVCGSLLMVSKPRAESSDSRIHPEGCKCVAVPGALSMWGSKSSISLSLVRWAQISVRDQCSTTSWTGVFCSISGATVLSIILLLALMIACRTRTARSARINILLAVFEKILEPTFSSAASNSWTRTLRPDGTCRCKRPECTHWRQCSGVRSR
jgi:hypothetical protein